MHIMNIPNFFNFWPFLCYSTLYSKEAQLISSLNLVYKQILQLMCESFSFEFKENLENEIKIDNISHST